MTNDVLIQPAPKPKRASAAKECRLCCGPHDEEVHAATLSIHLWLKDFILTRLNGCADQAAA